VEKVDAVLMSNCSGAVLGGMPVLQSSQTPGLVTASTSASITAQAGGTGNDWIFRMNEQDAVFARLFSRYIGQQGTRSIAFLATNTDFGRGSVEAFKPELAANRVAVVGEQYITQGAGDFRAQLTAIAAAHPAAILAQVNYPDAVVIFREMKELGLVVRFYSRGDVVSPAFLATAGDPHLGDGAKEITFWDSTLTHDQVYADKIQKQFNSPPSASSYVTGYWGMRVLAQAVQTGGPTRAGIHEGLKRLNLTTPIGLVKFDDHNQASTDVFVTGLVNGKITSIVRISGVSGGNLVSK
jgi:branched-chain amino acid transport system substrate-binding protein